jgi:HEAT repeat protein
MRTSTLVWLAVVVVSLTAAGVYLRMHIETVGDRQAICAHLQDLQTLVEMHPDDDRPLNEILEILNGSWPFARMYACGVLGELGPKARVAIPDLIEALQSSDEYTQQEAAKALGAVAVGDGRPVPVLVSKLTLEDNSIAWASASALGDIGAPAVPAIPGLEKAAKSKSSALVYYANQSLESLRKIEAESR